MLLMKSSGCPSLSESPSAPAHPYERRPKTPVPAEINTASRPRVAHARRRVLRHRLSPAASEPNKG